MEHINEKKIDITAYNIRSVIIFYEFDAKKTIGTSIGAVYYPLDKPYACWMGKLGLQELSAEDMSGTEATCDYHGRAMEALKEKVASDFFTLLSQGSYGVAKTRLAEIPLESVELYFQDPRVYMDIVVNRVNHDREDNLVTQGIFVISISQVPSELSFFTPSVALLSATYSPIFITALLLAAKKSSREMSLLS